MTKTIKVSDTNHKRLKRIGKMHESMDDVISILLDAWVVKK